MHGSLRLGVVSPNRDHDRLEQAIEDLRTHLQSQFATLSAQLTACQAELAATQAALTATQAAAGLRAPGSKLLIH